jgi:CubicO group peptidase (beta-lactamase class C family)
MKRFHQPLIVLSLLLLSFEICNSQPTFHHKVKEIAEAEARYDYFSGTVLVAKGDSIVYEGAFGYGNRDFMVPNSLSTKFNIGSITKTFTALSILQLVEQGKVSVEDTLSKFLPDCPVPEKNEITIHQLLTHTSGLYDYANSDVVFESDLINKRKISEMVPYVYGSGLLFKPGEDVAYSSGGYILLGAVIEKVTGMSYFDYVTEHILKPAQMKNTDFLCAEDVSPNKAEGYKQVEKDKYINRKLLDFPPSSAGGIWTTGDDLLRYVNFLFDNKLLSGKYLNLLISPKTKYVPGRGKAAYGWWTDIVDGREVVYHTGGTPGFSSSLYIFPDSGYTAVVLSNSFRGTTGITDLINSALTGRYYELSDQNTYDLRKGIDAYYQGDRKKAIQLLDPIIRSDKPSRRAYYYAATARIDENLEIPKAIEFLGRYIELSPPELSASKAYAWYRKGQAYERLNDSQNAVHCYETSLKLNPKQDGVRDALAALRKK